MEERYSRNIPSVSREECALLKEKTVFVAGCGGLGGHILDMLLRLGVGNIRCADGDFFDETNLNRQLLSDEICLGRSKAQCADEHAARVNSSVRFSAYEGFITEENALELIRGADVVIDALDTVSARKTVKSACDTLGIPFVYGAVSGWVAQAAVSMPGDGFLDMLYPAGDAKTEKSTLSFTPALCAAVQTSLCLKLLCSKEVESGRLYYIDLLDNEFETLF